MMEFEKIETEKAKPTNTERYEKAKNLDIFEVAIRLGLTLRSPNSDRSTTIEHGSLTLYRKAGYDDFARYSQHGRNNSGSTIDLVMHQLMYSHDRAVQWLLGDEGITDYRPIYRPEIKEETEQDRNDWSSAAEFASNKYRDNFNDGRYSASTEYITSVRGISPETLRAAHVGLELGYKTDAITFPWYGLDRKIVGIRKRFISPYNDMKMISRKGSRLRGEVFGLHMPIYSPTTLCFFEGEINALSANDVGYTALSFGSESARYTDKALLGYCKTFERVIVWADKREVSTAFKHQLLRSGCKGRVVSLSGIFFNGKHCDANDLHVGGLLAEYLNEVQ